MGPYCVYILASMKRVLYVGMTNDLRRRLYEHKAGTGSDFTARYKIDRLVYYECGPEPRGAIEREKQLKGWRRQRKVALVESQNPEWEDLADRVGLPDHVSRAP